MNKVSKRLGAKKVLIASKQTILKHLKKVIKNHNFNYRTFGTSIEDYVSEILIDVFKQSKIIKNKKDYSLAPDKNYFPDFELKILPTLAIDYKSGNKSKLSKGRWVNCKNSNNDMGTLRAWSKKIAKFGGENIYYIFIIYNFNNTVKEIIDVQIEPFYKFIGLNKNGLLRYREKDGNLRPKDFDAQSSVKNLKEFKALLKKTIIFRSKRIVVKHKKIIKTFRET